MFAKMDEQKKDSVEFEVCAIDSIYSFVNWTKIFLFFYLFFFFLQVRFSMLEIYNEIVRDLLNPSNKKGGLKVRQHPKKGFYGSLRIFFRYLNPDLTNSLCVEGLCFLCFHVGLQPKDWSRCWWIRTGESKTSLRRALWTEQLHQPTWTPPAGNLMHLIEAIK